MILESPVPRLVVELHAPGVALGHKLLESPAAPHAVLEELESLDDLKRKVLAPPDVARNAILFATG